MTLYIVIFSQSVGPTNRACQPLWPKKQNKQINLNPRGTVSDASWEDLIPARILKKKKKSKQKRRHCACHAFWTTINDVWKSAEWNHYFCAMGDSRHSLAPKHISFISYYTKASQSKGCVASAHRDFDIFRLIRSLLRTAVLGTDCDCQFVLLHPA